MVFLPSNHQCRSTEGELNGINAKHGGVKYGQQLTGHLRLDNGWSVTRRKEVKCILKPIFTLQTFVVDQIRIYTSHGQETT